MAKAPDTTPVETLAEVLCNIDGLDSTSPTHWGIAMKVAQQMKDEVAAGLMEPWWSEDL